MKSMSEIQNPATAPAVQQQGDAGRLGEAAKRLAETMALGRIPLVVIGSGMSAGVFAPTMSEIHTWLATEIQTEADNCGAKDLSAVQTIQALLGQLAAAKPAQGWSDDTAPASPRSVQVRLYGLLQTNKLPCVRTVWQRFGEALLMRKMVTRDAGESFDTSKTLAELDVSRAHAWAAILALQRRAIVASLNYDGLTRKAVEQLAKRHMALPPAENDEERRRTCQILSTGEDIRRFFSGIEAGLGEVTGQARTDGKLPWRPIPLIKFRGDVFHTVCHNEQCPEAEKPTPLYFVLPCHLGQELDVVALFDNDLAGKAAKDKLVKSWLPRYRDQRATALDLATAVGKPGQDMAIEDLFPERFYINHVQKAYEKEITTCGISIAPLPPGNLLAKRVESAFSAANVQFNKRRVCKRIAADIRQMKTPSDLPEQTRLMAEQLFSAITKAFSRA